MKTETIDALGGIGTKTMIAGGGISAFGAWAASNALGIFGVVVALLGLLVNYHFKRQAGKRAEQAAMEARLRHDAAAALQAQAIREESARRDQDLKSRLKLRELQEEMIRKMGGNHRDFTISDMAPLETPVHFEYHEDPHQDDEDDGN